MKAKDLISALAEKDIYSYEYKEDRKLCGYELNTYTKLGVNQIVFLDFRDTEKNPKNAKDFIDVFTERVESIDIDEEIELNRQNADYKKTFTIRQSLEDFEDWKNNLLKISDEFRTKLEKKCKEVRNIL